MALPAPVRRAIRMTCATLLAMACLGGGVATAQAQAPSAAVVAEDASFGSFREADLREFLRRLQKAVAAGRRADVARLVRFPIRVAASRQAFQRDYARIMTPGVRAALAAVDADRPLADQADVIAVVGMKGVMLGRGAIWIDAAVDAPGVPRIIGINPE